MVESSFLYNLCFNILPWILFGLLGMGLMWLFMRGKKHDGDLSIEGEGALRAEADGLRTRVRDLEGRVSTRDGEVSDLKTKLAAAAAGAAAATAAAKGAATLDAPKVEAADDDETYALEWRNRYLAARVKYLEGRLSEAPAPKTKAKTKKVVAKTIAAPKAKPAVKKKAAPKPKVLYTDGPTDGTPDDLKLIKGIGPKFEGDLNAKGIYYFRQIANWKAADVKMVEGVIDSIPGRIKRDQWVPQARGLAKSGDAKAPTAKKKAAPKAKAPKAKAASKPKVLYTDGPTDGTPDDLKLIKGIGPKFEGDLNAKGIYYFRQIANWKASDVTMVEGVIDSIPGRIKRDEWVKQAKGMSGKSVSAKKSKTAKSGASQMSDMDKYYANVKKHDSSASRDVVEKIVKYCGISLRSRDTSLVACSDKTEVATVVNGFVTKKLGITDGGQALVEGVCQDMKGERFKNRVTFYYLCAKKAGKLSVFN